MLPIIDGIDEVLGPLVDSMFSKNSIEAFEGLGREIGEFIKGGLEMIKPLIEIAKSLGPKGVLYTFLGAKALGWIADKATWFANGLVLAQGFNMASSGKGGFISSLGNMLNLSKGNLMKAGGLSIAGTAVGLGTDYLVQNQREKGNQGAADAINVGGSMASGALTGAAIGSLIPVIGTVVGGIVGGLLGGGVALYQNSQPQNDALFGSPIHDGFALGNNLGSDFSKNRGIIQGGKITPIDNKDDLLAMKPGGAVDKTLKDSQTKVMKIDFGEIHFKFDDLIVKAPGTGDQSKISKDLLNNPHFTRDMARMIHVETEKAINGGKLKG